jgi:hypothetical protein
VFFEKVIGVGRRGDMEKRGKGEYEDVDELLMNVIQIIVRNTRKLKRYKRAAKRNERFGFSFQNQKNLGKREDPSK